MKRKRRGEPEEDADINDALKDVQADADLEAGLTDDERQRLEALDDKLRINKTWKRPDDAYGDFLAEVGNEGLMSALNKRMEYTTLEQQLPPDVVADIRRQIHALTVSDLQQDFD